ncbi:uncharacterized protein LOC119688896 [Teleopsis dalmanni]|uniref:uncharacterized protein LOC119663548 n=1 Tax=Teleopsis dalmanni TaxID=139649 RepID=UPI0018CE5F7B|nr:uncharacterized protein LOC119663548 [Teleopsis dalmanni]XP_037959487.1 uncharacterized protein LOC119688896 [Teleopsis dalmanni]
MYHIIQKLIRIREEHPQIYKRTERLFQEHTKLSQGLTLVEVREKYLKMYNEVFPISPDENIMVEFLLSIHLMSTHRKRGASQIFYLAEPKIDIVSFIRDTNYTE